MKMTMAAQLPPSLIKMFSGEKMDQPLIEKKFLEIEAKHDASKVNRHEFKALVSSWAPTSFLYIEGVDVYYVKSETEFLRYRMPARGDESGRSELTFKKKSINGNNNIRTEVNLRIDHNNSQTVAAFCEGLGYKRNFSIEKYADIYFFADGNVVLYSVIDENKEIAQFIEIEASEDIGLTEDQAWEVVQKYEKLLAPLGISGQKRKRLSLFEMYRK